MSLHINTPINQHYSTSVLLYTLPTDFLLTVLYFLGVSLLSRPSFFPHMSFYPWSSFFFRLPFFSRPSFFFSTVILLPTIFSLSIVFFSLETLAILYYLVAIFNSHRSVLSTPKTYRLPPRLGWVALKNCCLARKFRRSRRLPKRAKKS